MTDAAQVDGGGGGSAFRAYRAFCVALSTSLAVAAASSAPVIADGGAWGLARGCAMAISSLSAIWFVRRAWWWVPDEKTDDPSHVALRTLEVRFAALSAGAGDVAAHFGPEAEAVSMVRRRGSARARLFVTFRDRAARDLALALHRAPWCDRLQMGDEEAGSLYALRARRAPAPSDVAWSGTALPACVRRAMRAVSLALCATAVVASWVALLHVRRRPMLGGAMLFAANAVLPLAMDVLTTELEVHGTQSAIESSMLVKLVAMQTLNGALLAVLKFGGNVLSDGFRDAVLVAMCSDLVLANAGRVLAALVLPRRFFGEWHVSARVANASRIGIYAFSFGPIVPVCFAIGALNVAATCATDAALHHRLWLPAPAWSGRRIMFALRCVSLIMAGMHLGAVVGVATWFAGRFDGWWARFLATVPAATMAIALFVVASWSVANGLFWSSLRTTVLGEDDDVDAAPSSSPSPSPSRTCYRSPQSHAALVTYEWASAAP